MCRQLFIKYKDFVWVIDEEFYFSLINSKINGNNNYYASNIDLTPNEVKFKTRQI